MIVLAIQMTTASYSYIEQFFLTIFYALFQEENYKEFVVWNVLSRKVKEMSKMLIP